MHPTLVNPKPTLLPWQAASLLTPFGPQLVNGGTLLAQTQLTSGMNILTCTLLFAAALPRQPLAHRQGKASFGDAGVFVEKYVQRARHIEVQIFGDGRGNIITLPERECSIQRRHQKARLGYCTACLVRDAELASFHMHRMVQMHAQPAAIILISSLVRVCSSALVQLGSAMISFWCAGAGGDTVAICGCALHLHSSYQSRSQSDGMLLEIFVIK